MKYLFLIFTCLLVSCGSEDMPIQHADDYGYITFSAQTEKMTSRTNPYEDYSPSKHPSTMGVFGYHDLSAQDEQLTANAIFNNETTTYNAASSNWQPSSPKKWNEYLDAKAFDFFAYMPQSSGAKITMDEDDNTAQEASGSSSNTSSSYTLTIPFSMPTGSCYLTNTQQAPIICALPDHKQATSADGEQLTFDRVVKMQFDQTLTAYQLLFMLDSKMGAIRQFRIKGVKLSGSIATGGNITRTYTWSTANKQWTAGDITWTDIQRTSDTDAPISINPSKSSDSADASESSESTESSLLITSTGYSQWGENLYMIPDASFQPTISVTYDVKLVAEDGSTVITRKDVTSSIILNKNNFSSLTTGKTAMIYPIRILIQPRYLYVLADDDAYTGHLLID